MFFGIFSGILPYVIAAGFYLVYILFSFAQPFLQNAFSKDKVAEKKEILIKEISTEANEKNSYNFENHSVDDTYFLEQDEKYPVLIPECPDMTSPPLACFYSCKLSFSLFSRPPPAC
ncbi:MAG: hypothetical protein ACOCWA_04765 [Bacteroidota bacterium]